MYSWTNVAMPSARLTLIATGCFASLKSVLTPTHWSQLRPPSFLARHARTRSLVAGVVGWLFQAYFKWRWARQLADRSGLVHKVWQTTFFRLPPASARETLLAALGQRPYPRLTAEDPVLVELWQQGETWQLHLVNYAANPQTVKIEFGRMVQGQGITPDETVEARAVAEFRASVLEFVLDVYAVLEYS